MALALLLVIYLVFISLGLPDTVLGSSFPAISGALGLDSDIAGYIGNSWIKAKFEIAVANLLISNSLIALRGGGGAALISNSLQDVINTAKSGGIITTVGIGNLLTSEKSAIVTATGNNNAVNLVESQGYYLNTLPINDEDIKLNRIRVQFIYTRNVAVNRVSVQTYVL